MAGMLGASLYDALFPLSLVGSYNVKSSIIAHQQAAQGIPVHMIAVLWVVCLIRIKNAGGSHNNECQTLKEKKKTYRQRVDKVIKNGIK